MDMTIEGDLSSVKDQTPGYELTPETYLGYSSYGTFCITGKDLDR